MDPHTESSPAGLSLSLVIPVYQRAHQVGETLAAVEGQTRPPDEVILVDNGSTDGSVDILQQWSRRMNDAGWRVRVLTEHRRGAARARQTGLESVTSAYVMFFDSDDIMPPRHIELALADLAAHPDADICAWSLGYECGGRCLGHRRIIPGRVIENHMVQGLLCTAAYAVRTSFLRRAGGWDPAIGGWDDWELGLRLLLRQPVIYVDPRPRLYVRVQEDSISGLGFVHRAGDWEHTLDAMERHAEGCADTAMRRRLLRLIAYRRVNLAAHYRREGRPDLGSALLARGLRTSALPWPARLLLRIAYLHTASGLPWAGGIYPPLLR
ncbi:MAG: glycosyltransferase family 2 protein [Muribaculaceae bacterium]|nr:glycosyltransferase family 2 protein [Muribaculaceae bacterium]